MNKKIAFFVLAGILVLGGGISWAQAPLFREQLVYSLTSFDGSGFSKASVLRARKLCTLLPILIVW